MTRFPTVLLAIAIAIVFGLGGCAVVSTERIGADGSRTTTRSVQIVPSQVYVPAYGTSDYRHYRGGYEAPYRIRPGEACRGSWGQTWNGVCYPEKPYGMQ